MGKPFEAITVPSPTGNCDSKRTYFLVVRRTLCGPTLGHRRRRHEHRVESLTRHQPARADNHVAGIRRGQSEAHADGIAFLGRADGMESIGVHARWNHGGVERSTNAKLGFGKRIPSGGDHVRGAIEDPSKRALQSREPAGDRDLGPVQHDRVRKSCLG